MPRTKISEFSATPASNTDIDSINISEGCAPSGINDAIRELMAQLKDFQTGAVGDSFNGPVGTTTAAAGAFTTLSSTGNTTLGDASGDSVTINGTATFANANPTLSAGTANGVAYLNGSKVVTSGSALTFDGTNLGVGTTSAGQKLEVYGTMRVRSATEILDISAPSGKIDFNNLAGDPLGFSIGSSEQMRLTSTGLGIGTSSPATKLQVSANEPKIRITSTAGSGKSWDISSGGNTTVTLGHFSIYDTTTDAQRFNIVSGTGQMLLDGSGNLGLGVTPSAWDTVYQAIQLPNGGSISGYKASAAPILELSSNQYYDGGYKYVISAAATKYAQNQGVHSWSIAPSGTAGNAITFTQAMTLDASGNLGIGETSPTSRLHVAFTSNSVDVVGRIQQKGNNTAAGFALAANDNNGAGYNFIQSETTGGTVHWRISGGAATSTMAFSTGGSERARIDSSGNLLVGTTSNPLGDRGLFASAQATNNSFALVSTDDSSGGTFIAFRNSAYTAIGTVARVTTTNAVVYNTTSDYRLKTVTGAVTGQGARIDALKPIDYLWTEGGQQARGFLAHEFQEVYPNSVTGDKDAVDANGNPVYQAMQASTAEVIADLVAEIKALRVRVAQLESN